jgi:hypothetical protein
MSISCPCQDDDGSFLSECVELGRYYVMDMYSLSVISCLVSSSSYQLSIYLSIYLPSIHPSTYLLLLLYASKLVVSTASCPCTISLSSVFISCLVSSSSCLLFILYPSPIHLSIYLLLLLNASCLYRQLSMHYLFIICYHLLSSF